MSTGSSAGPVPRTQGARVLCQDDGFFHLHDRTRFPRGAGKPRLCNVRATEITGSGFFKQSKSFIRLKKIQPFFTVEIKGKCRTQITGQEASALEIKIHRKNSFRSSDWRARPAARASLRGWGVAPADDSP